MKGPIYSVELIDTLPLTGGMIQAMPSRCDLQSAMENHMRVVAGYEVLLHHYRLKCAEVERLKGKNTVDTSDVIR